jgi:hypothetical protein
LLRRLVLDLTEDEARGMTGLLRAHAALGMILLGESAPRQIADINRPMLFVLLDSEGSMTRVGDANRLKKWAEVQS